MPPMMTPYMLPVPPSTTAAKNKMESCNWKLSGLTKPTLLAYKAPAKPPMAAPIANAHSLNLKVLTPISSAASSSSRTAAHARPTRLFSSRVNTKMTMRMTVNPRYQYGFAFSTENSKGPKLGGRAILLMPRGPPNQSELFAVMRMISPNPSVTIAR